MKWRETQEISGKLAQNNIVEHKFNKKYNESTQSELANEKTGCQLRLQELYLWSAFEAHS